MDSRSLIYDWNAHDVPARAQAVYLDDETLRDGLQSPSAHEPAIDQKIDLLHRMETLGIQIADLGLPAASPAMAADVERLAREIVTARLRIQAACAARTVLGDIEPIVAVSQRVGLPIEVHAFLGASALRQLAESWDLPTLLTRTREAVAFAVRQGCPVMFVTEDTTRTHPDTLRALLAEALGSGASRVCLCDTAGHATPRGVAALVRHVRTELLGDAPHIALDWHGHNDRGLALANALAAAEAGVDRLHGTALGIGERAGNAPIDLLLVNLRLFGLYAHDLRSLGDYCRAASRALAVPVPAGYPVVGADAFRTSTGVHAAAIRKAAAQGDPWLVDRVYSSVAAAHFGRQQGVEIGPMSGRACVHHWLAERGLAAEPALVDAVLRHAKLSRHVLSERDVYAAVIQALLATTPGRAAEAGRGP